VRPPDVNASDWDCTLEPTLDPLRPASRDTSPQTGEGFLPLPRRGEVSASSRTEGVRSCALRLGFRQVTGLTENDLKRFVERRTTPYRDPADVWRRGGLSKRQILALARADAFASLGLTRRDVLWAVRAFSDTPLPLLDARAVAR